MGLISQLSTILREKFIRQRRSQRGSVTLQDGQSDMKVKLIHAPMPFLVIPMSSEPIKGKRTNLDPSHLPALQDRGDLKKICDYLLIGQADDNDYAIFVELKKSLREETEDEDKPKEQLRRSLPILEYLLSVCSVEYDDTGKSDLVIRYILIAERTIGTFNKQGVRGGEAEKVKEEVYKSAQITTFVGTSVSFATLARS